MNILSVKVNTITAGCGPTNPRALIAIATYAEPHLADVPAQNTGTGNQTVNKISPGMGRFFSP